MRSFAAVFDDMSSVYSACSALLLGCLCNLLVQRLDPFLQRLKLRGKRLQSFVLSSDGSLKITDRQLQLLDRVLHLIQLGVTVLFLRRIVGSLLRKERHEIINHFDHAREVRPLTRQRKGDEIDASTSLGEAAGAGRSQNLERPETHLARSAVNLQEGRRG